MVNHGRILLASDMGWQNVDVAGHLARTLGYPSVVVNRHWASCLSEYHFGAGRGVQSLIYVGISTGIAASIILDGKLFTGADHIAGEIGHTVVRRNGPRCSCGRRGCLHAIASELALRRHVSEYYAAHPGPATAPDPVWGRPGGRGSADRRHLPRAAAGHPVADSELSTAALYLGLSISNLTSMFNPQRVVLGGSLIDHGGSPADRAHYRQRARARQRGYARRGGHPPLGARPLFTLDRVFALLVLDHKRALAVSAAPPAEG